MGLGSNLGSLAPTPAKTQQCVESSQGRGCGKERRRQNTEWMAVVNVREEAIKDTLAALFRPVERWGNLSLLS